MPHPPVSALLGDGLAPEIVAHVATCATCRRLAAHTNPVRRAEARSTDLEALPLVDPEIYLVTPNSEVRGGMGRTYVARDRRLGREVAIKQPLEPMELGDPTLSATLYARFEREARPTARLEHPAIVGVHEAGRFPDGQPFYAMRLVRGTPLALAITKRGSLAERIALLPNLTTIAEALAYAHSRGITHRDVKPGNILLGEFGETVLIDWGLASELADSTSVSRGSEIPLTEYGVGTPGYMPPEQASGQAAAAPADVYAFGATLYHLVAGTPPTSRPLSDVCPDAPPALLAVIGRAMAASPGDRVTAAELVEELRRFQTGRLVESHRYSPRELIAHYLRRYRTPLAIGAIGIVVLLVVSILYVRGLARETARAEAALREADASNQVAQAALRRQLGVTATELARDPARRLEALDNAVRAVAPDLARHASPSPEAWQGLLDALSVAPAGAPLTGHRGAITSFVFVANGTRLITAGSDHTLRIWELSSGRELARHPLALARAQSLVVSPDARHVLACGFDALAELIPLDGGASHPIPLPLGDARCGFAAARAIVAAGAEVRAFDPSTGAQLARAALPATATALAIAPNGASVIGLQTGELVSWQPDGTVASAGMGHPGGIRGVAFPDAAHLATAGVDGRLLGWAWTDAGPTTPTVLHAGMPVHFIELHRSGIGLVSAPGLVDLQNISTTIVRGDGATTIRAFSIAPDSATTTVLGITPERPRLVDPRSGHDALWLPPMPDRIHGAARSGDRVVVVSIDGAAISWDVRSARATGVWIGHTSEVTGLASGGGELWSVSLDGSVRRWTDDTPLAIDTGSELLALATTSSTLSATANDGTVRVYGRDGTARATLSLPGVRLQFAALDGARTITNGARGSAQLWDSNGRPAATLDLARPARTTAATSTVEGAILIGADDGSVTRFEHGARTLAVTAFETESSGTAAIDRIEIGPELVAVGTATTQLALLDRRTLAVRERLDARLGGRTGDHAIAFLADGRVELTPLGRGARRELDGHLRPVLAAAVSNRADRLATVDLSGAVRVWDLTSGRPIASFALDVDQLGIPTAIAFVDDAQVAVGGSRGLIRTMPIEAPAAVARACGLLRYFGRSEACD